MSNISDEVAAETHDLIHRAEVEEQQAHAGHALTQPDYGEEEAGVAGAQSTPTAAEPQKQEKQEKQGKQGKQGKHSTMDKVKEALHIKK